MSQRRGLGITVESTSRRGVGVLAKEILSADVEQYESINDAALSQGLREMEEGNTEIWYWKKSQARDMSMGVEWCIEHECLPDSRNLKKTHVFMGKIKERNPDKIFKIMQGEYWSPNGEANDFVRQSGSGHTSMSIGDIVKVGSKVLMVDISGFEEL